MSKSGRSLAYLVKLVIFSFIFDSIGNVHVQYYNNYVSKVSKRSFEEFLLWKGKNAKMNTQRKWWHFIFHRCELITTSKSQTRWDTYPVSHSIFWQNVDSLDFALYFLIWMFIHNEIHWMSHHYRSKNLVNSDSFVDVSSRKWPKMQRINVDVW